MSIKRIIVANYASQIYVTIVGIVMVPIYLRYMGAEAYGLVGFFAMLQTWFNLLDLGLTPTMAREAARYKGRALDPLHYTRLVHALEGIFLAVALVGAGCLFASTSFIAQDWLQASQLPLPEIRRALQFMAAIVGLRWMSGLYRGIITGSEALVWLGGYNSLVATLRFVGVLLVLIFIGVTPTHYFGYQLLVAVLELAGLLAYAYHLLPAVPESRLRPWDWKPIKPILRFSLSIAFATTLWVIVTQTDKLALSKLLSLSDYGYFTLAVLVAGGVNIVSGPIGSALLPRMTKLSAEGDAAGVIRLYRNATQLVCIIAIPTALVLSFFARQVLWTWTGSDEVAAQAAPVLSTYALGNCILVISGLAYQLQFAKGDMRLHLVGTPLFMSYYLPGLIWAVWTFGARGAGMAWFLAMLLSFLFWLPVIHKRFFKGQHLIWLMHDVGVVLISSLAAVSLCFFVMFHAQPWPRDRWSTALLLGLVALVAMTASILGSRLGRESLSSMWRAVRDRRKVAARD